MERIALPIRELAPSAYQLMDNWLLLTAGDFATHSFNAMTISWGSMGIMWGKPFVQVVVRPTRYTYEFMEKFDTFTLSAFAEKYRDVLSVLGSQSGRDSDKIAEVGLTPEPATMVATPVFKEAELTMECKKIYYHDIKPENFLTDYIAPLYNHDYHRAYFGEILAVTGVPKYRTA